MVKPNIVQNICILFVCISGTNSVKWWIDNFDFSNKINWENDAACSLDTILFPKEYSAGIILPKDLKTVGFILPIDGALILNKNAQITFGTERAETKCSNHNNLAVLKSAQHKSWFDPHNWGSYPGQAEKNPAKPHIERIPCDNEKVIIDHNGPLSIDLAEITNINLGGLHLAGYDTSSEYINYLLKTELGEIIFKNATSTKFEYSQEEICGCHSRENFYKYELNVCQHAMPCKIPNCRNPILPIGSCCLICGTQLLIESSDCQSDTLENYIDILKRAVINEGYENKITFYANFNFDKTLQIIVVDQYDYNSHSNEFVKRISDTIFKNKNTKHILSSGSPLNPISFSHGWIVMALTFLCVLVFFIIVFVHFVPENRYFHLPSWIYPNRYNVFRSPIVFARFDNVQQDVDVVADNVVLGTTYNDPIEPKQSEGSTSFNNPLFAKNVIKNPIETIENEGEQELTEIDLESLESADDVESVSS